MLPIIMSYRDYESHLSYDRLRNFFDFLNSGSRLSRSGSGLRNRLDRNRRLDSRLSSRSRGLSSLLNLNSGSRGSLFLVLDLLRRSHFNILLLLLCLSGLLSLVQ